MICVSFIITCYNYAEYVSQAINSCINQNSSNIDFEILVIDDGSTDGSVNNILDYGASLKFLQTPNLGVEQAFNVGLIESKGDYIVRVDADDFLKLDFLQSISEHLIPEIDILYGNYIRLKEDIGSETDIILPSYDITEILGRGDFLATGTVVRKQLFHDFSLYQNKIKNCGLEHYELILNCIKNDKNFKKLDKKLFYYRIHNDNMSSVRQRSIFEYGEQLFDKDELGKYKIGNYHPYRGSCA